MINITKNTINDKVIVTVTEKVTLVNPFFLFQFKKEETNDFYYCIAANTSTEKQRYDKFSIEDKANPNPLVGEVNLPIGTYQYWIYEQSSSTNLDPTLTTSEVEQSLATVIKIGTSPIITYESANTKNISYIPTP